MFPLSAEQKNFLLYEAVQHIDAIHPFYLPACEVVTIPASIVIGLVRALRLHRISKPRATRAVGPSLCTPKMRISRVSDVEVMHDLQLLVAVEYRAIGSQYFLLCWLDFKPSQGEDRSPFALNELTCGIFCKVYSILYHCSGLRWQPQVSLTQGP